MIDKLRSEIDGVDVQLVELLKKRFSLSLQAGACKRERELPVLAPERERELLERVEKTAGEELRDPVARVFRSILSASRAVQKQQGCGRFGLIGERLGHSFSPTIHRRLGAGDYRLFELQPEELGGFLRQGGFDGLNVTIPYKRAVIPYCRTLTEQAEHVGSVNTIVRQPDGSLLGHNTDYDGFRYLMESAGAELTGK